MAKKIKVKKPKGLDIALQYYQSGNLPQAEMICRQILDRQPNHADNLHLLGLIEYQKNQYDNAIHYISRALYLNSKAPVYYYDIAEILAQKGKTDEAIENYRKALMLKPDYVEAYNNLAIALQNKNMLEEAIENYEKALLLKPDSAELYNNLGEALRRKCLLNEAKKNYLKALALKPDFAEAYCNLGHALSDMGILDEAIESYGKALALKPYDANMQKNLGMAYLLAKNFEDGWKHYEWRLKTVKVFPLTKPKWDGCTLKDKTILVYAEQGYGDTMQFVRYLPKLYDNYGAKKVLLILQKGLEQLLRENELKAEILNASTPIATLDFDTNIHLLSLPRIFKTNLDNMPFKQKRYLKADPEKVKWYRDKFFSARKLESEEVRNLGNEAERKHRGGNDLSLATPAYRTGRCHLPLKIGIFWHGNPTLVFNRLRSMQLHHFYPLCRLKGVKIYSLQKGYGIEQLDDLPDDIEIVNLGETLNDFSDTAAAIDNLDLVITIDSAVAHLSGALGKKTWILLPSHAEWRWHLDMDYSPWYEDVKLFRHKEMGKKDWEEMMERVVEELKKAISG